MVDLLTLLLRPQSGAVLIDGVPGEEVELASWRTQIGYVSQETVVFDDTIAANIALQSVDPGRDTEVMQRVRDAARRAHIGHFVEEQLPDGYATVAGDRGVRLSGGQRQRLFIARELFKRPDLLILDEATSALDSESERAIQESIDSLRGEMTVVIIAHRLSTIRNVDRVFVLENGQVVEDGAYEELRARADSRFRDMVELQVL
jgi:ABC-type multidrug transport system fused ATPase/permease subunit